MTDVLVSVMVSWPIQEYSYHLIVDKLKHPNLNRPSWPNVTSVGVQSFVKHGLVNSPGLYSRS